MSASKRLVSENRTKRIRWLLCAKRSIALLLTLCLTIDGAYPGIAYAVEENASEVVQTEEVDVTSQEDANENASAESESKQEGLEDSGESGQVEQLEAPEANGTIEANDQELQGDSSGLTASSADGTTPVSEFEYAIDSDTVTITKFSGAETTVVIPATIEGLPVVRLESDAFSGLENLEEVTVPESLTSIETSAFVDLPKLCKVTVEGDVGYVNKWVTDEKAYIKNCPAFEELHLGPNVAHYYEGEQRLPVVRYTVDSSNTTYHVDDQGILYKTADNSVVAYPICSPLESVVLNSVDEIGDRALAFASNVKQIEANVTSGFDLGYHAMYSMDSLEYLNISNVIGACNLFLLEELPALKHAVVTGTGSALVSLPADGENIHCDLFEVGEGVRRVYVSGSHHSIKHLSLGKDVAYIGYAVSEKEERGKKEDFYGFFGCMSEISVDEENGRFAVVDNALYEKDLKTLWGIPRYDKRTSFLVLDGVEHIGNDALHRNKTIGEVLIPDSVKSIGDDALRNGLITNVYLSKNVSSIGEDLMDNQNVTPVIQGYTGSYAQTYAQENKYHFDALDRPAEAVSANTDGYDAWDGSSVREVVPTKNTYVITKASELAWIAKVTNDGSVDFTGKTVKLAADINLCNASWAPIGIWEHPFTGSFNGQGHTVINLQPNPTYYDGGLFGCVESSVPGKELTLRNVVIKGFVGMGIENCGTLAGYLSVKQGTSLVVKQISAKGKINSCTNSGGIAAVVNCGHYGSSVFIVDCTANVGISTRGQSGSGGIVQRIEYDRYDAADSGAFGAEIRNCTYNGNMSGTGWYGGKGGIVQTVTTNGKPGASKISKCVSYGSILGAVYTNAAGIIANPEGSLLVEHCVNNMNVDCGYAAGGIAATVGESTVIRECANDGYVCCNGSMSDCGGIAGTNHGVIEDCLNFGEVAVCGYSGGIAGNNSGGTIQRCYDRGFVGKNQSAVARSGAITSYNTGSILHSYFDIDLVPSGKVAEFQSEDSTCDDALGYGTVLMKMEETYQTWDFNNVWDFDSHYCEGYPMLRGLVGLMRMHKDTSSGSTARRNALFTVVDQDGTAVEGATVDYGTAAGNATGSGVTDKEGEVELEYHADNVGIKVTKDGFFDYVDAEFELPRTKEYTFRIVNASNAEPYALSSVMLNYNEFRYELLAEEVTLNKEYVSETFSMSARLCSNTVDVDHFELVQPAVSQDPIASSDDGRFSLAMKDLSQTRKRGLFGKVKEMPLYMRVVDMAGDTHDTKINLVVVAQKEMTYEAQFGKNVSFKVDADTPLFGGMEFEIPGYKLPLSVVVSDDGSWEATLNLAGVDFLGRHDALKKNKKPTLGDTFKWFGSEINEQTKPGTMNKRTKELYEDIKQYIKHINLPAAKRKQYFNQQNASKTHGSLTLNVFGYASGDSLDWKRTTELTMKVYVVLEAGYSSEWQVIIGNCPCVWALDIKGGITSGGELFLDNVSGLKSGRVIFEPELTITGFLGAGAAYVASAGGYGEATLAGKAQLFTNTDDDGFYQVTLDIKSGLGLRMAGSQAASLELLNGKFYLYNRDISTDRLNTQAADDVGGSEGLLQIMSDTSDDVLVTFDRSSYKDIATSWSPGGTTLYDKAYCDLEPTIITANGVPIMLMLADGDTGRPTNDKSMLMYSVYNASKGTWSQPLPVWDDGTADFKFDAVSDGSNAYVVWSNSKGAIADGVTYGETLANTEVAIARFDGSSFVEAQNISFNSTYEIQPRVILDGSNPVVSWSTNDSDIFRFSGKSDIAIARRNGNTWNTQKIGEADGCMLQSSFGMLDGQPSFAYVMNEGGNVNDATGYKMYVVTGDGATIETPAIGATNVFFANIGGQEKLMWTTASGSLFTMDSAYEEIGTGAGVDGAIKQVVRDEATGNIAVLYTRRGQNNANAYVCTYDAASNTWSGEVALTSRDNYVEGLTGCYVNGEFLTAYNCRTVNLDTGDLIGTNGLMWNKAGQASHLVPSSVRLNKYAVEAGATLPVEVEVSNTGNKVAQSYRVVIGDSEGGTYLDRTINEPVAAGSAVAKSFDVTLPSDLTKRELTVMVTDPACGKTYNDNSASESLGDDEIYIEARHYVIGKGHTIAISAINEGLGAASGTIELYNRTDGTIYNAYVFKGLSKGDVVNYRVPLEMIDWSKTQDLSLGVRLVNGDGVLGNHERTLLIASGGVDDVESVTLDHDTLTLGNDATSAKLEASVQPDSAVASSFEWWSTDEDVVTVDQEGTVTAVAGGTARIYAKESTSGAVCSCEVTCTLKPKVKSIKLSKTSIRMAEGKGETLTATILPEEAAEGVNVTWSSSNESVAKVSNGVVSAVKEGACVITAAVGDVTATCDVSVAADPNLRRVDSIEDFQSEHPYEKNTDIRWVYQAKNAKTEALQLVFDGSTETEEWYDTIYIYDGSGSQIGEYDGTDLAGAIVLVPGGMATVRLVSDGSTQAYGFAVTGVNELDGDSLPVEITQELDNDFYVGDILQEDDLFAKMTLPKESEVTWESSNPAVAHKTGDNVFLLSGLGDVTLNGSVQATLGGEKRTIARVMVKAHVTTSPYQNRMIVTDTSAIGTNGSDDYSLNEWVYFNEGAGHMSLTFDEDATSKSYGVEIFAIVDGVGWKSVGYYDASALKGQTVLVPSNGVMVSSYGTPKVVKSTMYDGPFKLNGYELKASKPIAYVDDTITCTLTNINPSRYAGMRLPVSWSNGEGLAEEYEDGSYRAESVQDRTYVCSTVGGVTRYASIQILPQGSEPAPMPEPKPETKPIKVSKIVITSVSNKIAAGKKVQLTANVSPNNASNKAVVWKTSNAKVAKVSATGVVTMQKKSGGKSVIITALAKDGSGVKAMYKITSMKGVVKKIKLKGKASVKANKTITLKAKVTATKGANKKLKWSSSNTKYATVSSKGKVKAKKAGKGKKVKITCVATDGSGKKASKTVTIK